MYKDTFIQFYFNELRLTEHFSFTMANTVEASGWHREANVLVHTDMVVVQYVSLVGDIEWTHRDLLGAFASAFHDTGKPKAEQVCVKVDSDETYRKYSGHELVSARVWEEWAFEHYDMLKARFAFKPYDIYAVGWMIQSHLPFSIKKPRKRESLRRTALHTLGSEGFRNCVIADSWGRISDNHDTKKADLVSWLSDFNQIEVDYPQRKSDKTVIMFIGASGSGKSTYASENVSASAVTHSMDDLRLDWYSPNTGDLIHDYHQSFVSSCDDPTFKTKVQRHYIDLLKADESTIIVDNTNLSAKRRNFYTTEAHKFNYNVVAVIFPINRSTLMARQTSRTDKHVPPDAVLKHWWGVQYPSLGEVDKVIVHLS